MTTDEDIAPSRWVARLLSLGGLLESVVGVGLLVAPNAVSESLLRAPLDRAGLVVARLAGGGLLALGIACWCARKSSETAAGVGVALGFLVYNAVACVALTSAGRALGSDGRFALAASVLHGAIGAALLGALIGRAQTSLRD